jgi:tetratricopeptide (TPR) repeat protein
MIHAHKQRKSVRRSGTSRVGRLATSLLACCGMLAQAADREPFGIHLQYPQALVEALPEVSLSTERLAQYQNQLTGLQNFEDVNGPYHPSAAEMLQPLAETALSIGRLEEADEMLRRALHNIRINEGLRAESQRPILETLMRLSKQRGLSEEYIDRLAYLHRLSENVDASLSNDFVQISDQYLAARQNALMDHDWRADPNTPLRVIDTSAALAKRACDEEPATEGFCTTLTLRHLASLYLLDHLVEPLVVEFSAVRRTPANSWQESPWTEQLESMAASVYPDGVRLLERALAVFPENVTLELALADWRWFHNKRGAARRSYRELVASGASPLQQPVPIPQWPTLQRAEEFIEDPAWLEFALTITPGGRPTTIEVVGGSQNSDALRGRALRWLRQLIFRPAFNADGEAVASDLSLRLTVVP